MDDLTKCIVTGLICQMISRYSECDEDEREFYGGAIYGLDILQQLLTPADEEDVVVIETASPIVVDMYA